jgi:hypothetical protein
VLGDWLQRNGESIYGAGRGLQPGAYYGPSTATAEALYLHVVGYPSDGMILICHRKTGQVDVLESSQQEDHDEGQSVFGRTDCSNLAGG